MVSRTDDVLGGHPATTLRPDGLEPMVAAYGTVSISGKEFRYEKPWSGNALRLSSACPYIAFDTETGVVDDLSKEVPRLALASFSDGRRHGVLEPDQVGRFILAHAGARWITHNAAFDYGVVDKHLRGNGELAAAQAWEDACGKGRLHDTMLLDALVRLGEGEAEMRSAKDRLPMRNLGEVGAERTSLRADKDSPFRLRYGELLANGWDDAEEGFFGYAVTDAIVAYRAYMPLRDSAERLMRTHVGDILPGAAKRFGMLSEAIQVKGAVALAQATRNGMRLDQARISSLKAKSKVMMAGTALALHRAFPGIVKTGPDGEPLIDPESGAASVCMARLRESLAQAAEVAGMGPLPKTPKGMTSTSASFYEPHATKHPLFRLWSEQNKATKLSGSFTGLQGESVHPRYTTLLRTGRTSCSKPNIQQIPRDGGFRELFVPSPGHLLLAIDYSYIELRTLAAVCEARYGFSRLADTIRAGIDPHCHTAAMLLGMPLEEFMATKGAEDGGKEFKRCRQSAKAVNFGVPGGLGAKALVEYARSTFGAEMSEEQAADMRRKLVTDIYPELNETDGYLADKGLASLAASLGARLDDCRKRFCWQGGDDRAAARCVEKIVQGEAYRSDGTPYSAAFVRRTWDALDALNRNGDPRLGELLEARQGCKELRGLLFKQSVATLTGRVRGDVSYTQARNTPFQSLAADGAKLALWDLTAAGYRVVGFVHDEVLVELPDQGGYVDLAACEDVKRIACEAMAGVVPGVPIDAEYVLGRRWSKEAKLVVQGGKVLPWEDGVDGE